MQKLTTAALLLALFTAAPASEPRPDLTLEDGQVLKAARIVHIGEKLVTIVHAGGTASVPPDAVPLDVLARASMDLEAKTGERQKQQEAATARAAERVAESDAKKAEEIKIRLAMANVRAANQGDEQVAEATGMPAPSIDATLRVTQVVERGILATGEGWTGPRREVPPGTPYALAGTGLDSHKSYSRQPVDLRGPIFVECNTQGLIDGAELNLRIWRDGTHRYTQVTGAVATVARYTTAQPAPRAATRPAQAPKAGPSLAALKAKFPALTRQSVTVKIEGRSRSSSWEKMEIEVPNPDVWSWYRGMVQTTTVEALPVTITKIEERMEKDLAELSKRQSGKDESARAQASRSIEWLNRTLKPYLAQLRQAR